ncbi:MAG: energy transducer TonB [Acidobacteria bacterium]|nr:energy transducer TonB [Acidobacteriota bacterium]
MTLLPAILVVAILGLQQPGASLTVDELTQVRELYALASYEEALARLDAAGSRISPERAAQYRVLCLLGLSRTVDAERAIERLVMEHPSYAIPEAEVPPRLFAMFRDTRQRLLPTAARARYTEAKGAFDRQQFVQAARGFREVQSLLSDASFIADVDGLRDLRVLSEGFLNLAESEARKAELAAAQPVTAAPAPVAAPVVAAAPPVTTTPAAVTATAPAAPAAAVVATPAADVAVYSEADALVRPPVEVNRRLPAWNPPPALARMEFRGQLEVIIDQDGRVASATMVQPVHPTYDTSLIDATSRWRFRPATRDEAPVRYRKTFEIVLNRR